MQACGAIWGRGEEYNVRPAKKDVEENEVKCTLTSFQEEAESQVTVRLLAGEGRSSSPSTPIKLETKPGGKGACHSCVPFPARKLSSPRKSDPFNSSGKEKTRV